MSLQIAIYFSVAACWMYFSYMLDWPYLQAAYKGKLLSMFKLDCNEVLEQLKDIVHLFEFC